MKNQILKTFSDKYYRDQCYELTMRFYKLEDENSKLRLEIASLNFKNECLEHEMKNLREKEYYENNRFKKTKNRQGNTYI